MKDLRAVPWCLQRNPSPQYRLCSELPSATLLPQRVLFPLLWPFYSFFFILFYCGKGTALLTHVKCLHAAVGVGAGLGSRPLWLLFLLDGHVLPVG